MILKRWALPAILALSATSAGAQEVLMSAGDWDVITDGSICGMVHHGDETSLGIMFKGDNYSFTLANEGWSFPAGKDVPLAADLGGTKTSLVARAKEGGLVVPTGDPFAVWELVGKAHKANASFRFDHADGRHLAQVAVDSDFMEAFNGVSQCITLFLPE